LKASAFAEPVAWTIVLALLLQVWVATPLGMAMSAEPAFAGVPCGSGEHAPERPAEHEHQRCVLCVAAAVPLLSTPALSAHFPWGAQELPQPVQQIGLAAASRLHAYSSRAPPIAV
jgi:hypothetical protein